MSKRPNGLFGEKCDRIKLKSSLNESSHQKEIEAKAKAINTEPIKIREDLRLHELDSSGSHPDAIPPLLEEKERLVEMMVGDEIIKPPKLPRAAQFALLAHMKNTKIPRNDLILRILSDSGYLKFHTTTPFTYLDAISLNIKFGRTVPHFCTTEAAKGEKRNGGSSCRYSANVSTGCCEENLCEGKDKGQAMVWIEHQRIEKINKIENGRTHTKPLNPAVYAGLQSDLQSSCERRK
ncbi:hypothetical protein EGR_07979 [Echinococcus granulosus]|uniref:Uncharacterized protein n=1 Tax=Echinococcus granulosus TaxID=6210 RepID=W6UG90_ECHGR|nr:hypothetical protein EGR_07979 [Echinococcus granulosus]EUB57162.1 hypothetical protein EGR_07979 [Echinococcus granulosus]